jgi:hypothetical protein
MKGVAVALVALGVVTTAGATPPKIVQAVRANLDSDPAHEQLQVLDQTVRNPYGGTIRIHVQYGRILDHRGRLAVTVTPRVEHLSLRPVKDGAEDETPDIWYWGSLGGAGAVPRFFGLVDWNGRKARVLWRYSALRSSVRHQYAGARAGFIQDVANGGPGYEIRLQEGVRAPADPNCCPTRERISLYRYDGSTYVLYERFFVRL